jgi:hypothetical protein
MPRPEGRGDLLFACPNLGRSLRSASARHVFDLLEYVCIPALYKSSHREIFPSMTMVTRLVDVSFTEGNLYGQISYS